ncbi:MAG: hypothetical protein JRF51_06385 [Deltaproteobacteria bacterium]|nr:hypothetical protein [Deltaproteobacteria bacterium]HDZ90531.1 hypothetical protein [Deltaproteobacteria bacterium]
MNEKSPYLLQHAANPVNGCQHSNCERSELSLKRKR